MKPKKGSSKKLLSFLLTFAMVVSLVSAMTFAASAAEADDAVVIEQDENLIEPEETVPGQDENTIEQGEIVSGQDENLTEQEEVVPELDEDLTEQEEAAPAHEENGNEPEQKLMASDSDMIPGAGVFVYGNYVWFGNQDASKGPVLWKVMGDGNTGQGKLLLSKNTLAQGMEFGNDNNWNGSYAQDWCRSFYQSKFTGEEKKAVLSTTKTDPDYSVDGDTQFATCTLNNEKVFFLSAEEVLTLFPTRAETLTNYVDNYRTGTWWWLRSPSKTGYEVTLWGETYKVPASRVVGYVDLLGYVGSIEVNSNNAYRPAFNIDDSYVLFSTKVPNTSNEYKLTIKDDTLHIAVPKGGAVERIDSNLYTIPLITNRVDIAAMQTPVMITDKPYNESGAKILQYTYATSYDDYVDYDDLSTEIRDFTIDDSITGKWGEDYHVYIMALTPNEGKLTDYASEPVEIFLPVDPVAVAPTGVTASYGQKLGDVELVNPEGNTDGIWTWEKPTVTLESVGEHTYKANFTPADTTHYKSVTRVNVKVKVVKGDNPASITDTATVIRGGYTVDLSKNIKLNGATGAVSYEIIGDALGCTLNGSILTSGGDNGCVTVNVAVADDGNYYALAATPVTVTIKDVTYLEASWNETEKMVEYTEKSVPNPTIVKSIAKTGWAATETWNGWYVVTDPDVTIDNIQIIVSGTVNLVLSDGAKLTANAGIEVAAGNTLNIYAQSYYGDDMGVLSIDTTTTGDPDVMGSAAIGGSSSHRDCGTVTIHGGIVNAKSSGYGAAIGGAGFGGTGGTVTIYGGEVTAESGYDGRGGWAAGIGGGGQGYGAAGGRVTVYEGTVTATSIFGAGIGGGQGYDSGAGAIVAIYGGIVTASTTREFTDRTGGIGSVGIGMGSHDGTQGHPTNNGTLTLGEDMYLFGGADAFSAERIVQKDGDYERCLYMQALNPSGGFDDPDMCWHEWESIDAVPATSAKAGSTAGIICKECGEYLLQPTKIDKIRSITLNKKKFTYNGSVQRPVVTVTDSAGAVITANNYTLSYSDKKSREAGDYTVTVTFRGNYSGKKTLNYSIVQAKNPLTVSPLSKTYKQTALQSAASFTIKAAKAQGKVTYTRDAAAKKAKINVTSKGKVTIPKNCKKGTYKITVKAKGNKNYKAGTKTVTITVK